MMGCRSSPAWHDSLARNPVPGNPGELPPRDQHPRALTLTVIRDDPADNRYLECAVEGEADFLVTGDRLLLNLSEYQDVKILTPCAFLEVLQR